jgi:hypothetical protein
MFSTLVPVLSQETATGNRCPLRSRGPQLPLVRSRTCVALRSGTAPVCCLSRLGRAYRPGVAPARGFLRSACSDPLTRCDIGT